LCDDLVRFIKRIDDPIVYAVVLQICCVAGLAERPALLTLKREGVYARWDLVGIARQLAGLEIHQPV